MTGRGHCVECGRELNADGRCPGELHESQVIGLVFALLVAVSIGAWWWLW